MPLRDTLTPFGRKCAQDRGQWRGAPAQVFWLGGRRHGLGHTREGIAQSILFRMIEGGPQNLAADALQILQHLVRGELADQQKQCRIAGLQALRNFLHEGVVDADVGQPAAERTGGRADRSADERHQEIKPISVPQKVPETAPAAVVLMS